MSLEDPTSRTCSSSRVVWMSLEFCSVWRQGSAAAAHRVERAHGYVSQSQATREAQQQVDK